jgi:hypothetical protein
MKKRERLLNALRWLLLGEHDEPAPASSAPEQAPEPEQPSTPPFSVIERSPQAPPPPAMTSPEAKAAQLAPTPSADQFPAINDEIRDLLASVDWEEVNQGLELLVSSLGEDAIRTFTALIDAAGLRVKHLELWKRVLGISTTHEINAVAKLAELSGCLAELRSIRLNRAAFADEIQLDLSLLSGAASLEELIVNGGSIGGIGALSELSSLRSLALVSDSVDWDTDEHAELFSGLTGLRSLCLSQWPWEDLAPLTALGQLERLDLRGGELTSLEGVDQLGALTSLSLSDFYSLSEVGEIGSLGKLRSLRLLNLCVSSLEGLEGLQELTSIELEGSDLVDVAALAAMPNLTSVRLDCGRDLVGLGSLAALPSLRQLKLGDIPNYSYGEEAGQHFGRSEMDRLCRSWKPVQRRSSKVSSLAAEGADLPVVLLSVSVLETLAGHIDAADFSERLEQISSHWGPELRSRAYWPRSGGTEGYSQTAPIGQWLHRAAGHVSTDTRRQIAEALANQLADVPQRS